jgi:hypothetical protein
MLIALFGVQAEAVPPVGQLTIGWGVDQADPVQRQIAALFREYISSADPSVRSTGTDLWCESDQEKRFEFDLTAQWVYKGVRATLLEITPTSLDSTEYWVKVLYASSGEDGVQPFGLQRLLAQREDDRWVLCGALDVITLGWNREVVGDLVYHFPDEWDFDPSAANSAADFLRKLSADFGVGLEDPIDYYLAPSPAALARTIGLDWTVPGVRGKTYVSDHLIFVGDLVQREAYLHELVHIVLSPLEPESGWHPLISEGIASWLGGSRGLSFGELVDELRLYQEVHPEVGFQDVVGRTLHRAEIGYNTGAVIMECLYQKGGLAAVKRGLATVTSGEAVFQLLKSEFGVSEADATEWWRQATAKIASQAE